MFVFINMIVLCTLWLELNYEYVTLLYKYILEVFEVLSVTVIDCIGFLVAIRLLTVVSDGGKPTEKQPRCVGNDNLQNTPWWISDKWAILIVFPLMLIWRCHISRGERHLQFGGVFSHTIMTYVVSKTVPRAGVQYIIHWLLLSVTKLITKQFIHQHSRNMIQEYTNFNKIICCGKVLV